MPSVSMSGQARECTHVPGTVFPNAYSWRACLNMSAAACDAAPSSARVTPAIAARAAAACPSTSAPGVPAVISKTGRLALACKQSKTCKDHTAQHAVCGTGSSISSLQDQPSTLDVPHLQAGPTTSDPRRHCRPVRSV